MDLITRNKEMLEAKAYNPKDTCDLLKISQLKNPNDYDLFLIACALCNYDIPDLAKAEELRMKYYNIISNSSEDYAHAISDYVDYNVKTDIHCVKTGRVNKYGLHEYEIDVNDPTLVSKLWDGKNRECLSYVDSKSDPDKITVSIRPEHLNNFINLLDELMIDYERGNLERGIVFLDNGEFDLVDIKTLDLPWELKPYQIEDAKKILQHRRYLIGNEQGTGKTIEAILVGMSLDMPKLVICPPSLRLNWYNEIKQAKHDADVEILYSEDMFHMGKEWTIIGYKSVKKFIANLSRYFDCIIVDECHNCKAVDSWGRPASQRAEAVLELASAVNYCYLLSGTPMPSKNRDLFNCLKMLQLKEFNFGNQYGWLNYANKYCGGEEKKFRKWDPVERKVLEKTVKDFDGCTNSEELHEILSKVMVRHLRKEVLPDLTKQRQFIPVSPKLSAEYKNIEKRLYKPNKDPNTGRVTDTYMSLAMTGRAILSKIKAETAIDLAQTLVDAEESVVIVVNFVESADYIKSKFKNNCCEIRGGMTDKAKQKAIDDFQNGKYKVCIINMVAGGVGVTLTKAHTEIIIDYSWIPSDMAQVEDRICRVGQTEGCLIYYVYCPTSIFDRVFIKLLSDKSNNIDTVVDGKTEDDEGSYNLSAEKLANTTFIEELKAEIQTSKPEEKKAKKSAKATK